MPGEAGRGAWARRLRRWRSREIDFSCDRGTNGESDRFDPDGSPLVLCQISNLGFELAVTVIILSAIAATCLLAACVFDCRPRQKRTISRRPPSTGRASPARGGVAPDQSRLCASNPLNTWPFAGALRFRSMRSDLQSDCCISATMDGFAVQA